MRDLSDVYLPPEDFDGLARLCRNDRDFPNSVEAWNVMTDDAKADAVARNIYSQMLLLDVQEFGDWCERLNLFPCLDARRAFVIIKRRGAS